MLLALIIQFILTIPNVKLAHRERPSPSFYVIPIGTTGGLEEDNLSAYLLTSVTNRVPSSAYISLDGGTIRSGIRYNE